MLPGWLWWVPPLIVTAALYGLALRRTAGVAAGGVAVAAALSAGTAIALGEPARSVTGVALLAVGLGAVTWALGRARRRGRARRLALAAYRAAAPDVPGVAAEVERHRLAAELHDTAAHRLTGIVVGSASALRLADQALVEEAARHAAETGRLAVEELERLTDADTPAGRGDFADLDALIATWPDPRLSYRRTGGSAPPEIAAVAYRVVREALTNALRYGPGGDVRVGVEREHGRLLVSVVNTPGDPAVNGGDVARGLGGGHGLAGLRAATAACGGSLSAGPEGQGWAVRAELPLAPEDRPPSSPSSTYSPSSPSSTYEWRGRQAADVALAILALALSIGTSLVTADVPEELPGEVALLVPLFAAHALPLALRRRAPLAGLAAALSVYPLLLAAGLAGWTTQPAGDVFLWCLWVELALLYAVGAYGRPALRRWGAMAPAAVAAVGGLALACGPGIIGNRLAAWAVLAMGVAVPATATWALGLAVAARRGRRRTAMARERDLLGREAAAVVLAERSRLAAELRRTALRHARAIVAAADARRLDDVLAEARAGLAALRESLDELRLQGDDPPPTIAGIALLAARHQGAVRYAGTRRAASPSVEVAAFRAAELILRHGGPEVTVACHADGVAVSGPSSPGAERRLRALADAAGGGFSQDEYGTTRVWIPEVLA
ncbi:sensor histidine kinase [Microtetraspora fusca]|uniref:sensor histidine kinase n=1 Tax=Microtetraspora fusca TaxID=1997 RepID=UPI000833A871|nr:ATP-binding protein [Microtetraspora fusca]